MPPMSRNFVFVLILVYLIVGIISFVTLLHQNFKTDSQYKALQNEILETQLKFKEQELQYLKKQIHPHFLFNTLNTIYGLSLKQSKSTPDVILKLSNLLDYILYQADKPKVSLKEEILHIEEYIELERIRFQDNLKVGFIFDEIPQGIETAPMLFIPFVENAFKHGSFIDGFLLIDVNIALSGNQLSFSIRNTALNEYVENKKNGIGLENITKRLALIYGESYHLKIKHEDYWFSVNLEIENINSTKDA